MTTELNLMELTLITNHTILSFQYTVYIYCFPWRLGLTMGSTNKGINVEPMGINIEPMRFLLRYFFSTPLYREFTSDISLHEL